MNDQVSGHLYLLAITPEGIGVKVTHVCQGRAAAQLVNDFAQARHELGLATFIRWADSLEDPDIARWLRGRAVLEEPCNRDGGIGADYGEPT